MGEVGHVKSEKQEKIEGRSSAPTQLYVVPEFFVVVFFPSDLLVKIYWIGIKIVSRCSQNVANSEFEKTSLTIAARG